MINLSSGIGELAGRICSAGYLFLAIQRCMLEQAYSLATALVLSTCLGTVREDPRCSSPCTASYDGNSVSEVRVKLPHVVLLDDDVDVDWAYTVRAAGRTWHREVTPVAPLNVMLTYCGHGPKPGMMGSAVLQVFCFMTRGRRRIIPRSVADSIVWNACG